MESYNGEIRQRHFATKVQGKVGIQGPRLVINENKALLDRLNIYSGMPEKVSDGQHQQNLAGGMDGTMEDDGYMGGFDQGAGGMNYM